MKKIVPVVISMLFLMISTNAISSEAIMKETIVKIINQLQNIKPLIEKAAKEQPKNPRVKIHFKRFKDGNGESHNGLKEDINSIQSALIEFLNKQSVEPRHYSAIDNDFIGDPHG